MSVINMSGTLSTVEEYKLFVNVKYMMEWERKYEKEYIYEVYSHHV